ncbi:MAG: hypothetical protein JWM14_1023 [Chitinophagaceae bacterium]|nr:hypothetical protein [Chitinophagaceae bacterium]
MAEEEKNSIDDIFSKKLSDYTPSEPLEKASWEAIHSKLDKNMFYRFKLTHFNVYYCAFILFSTSYTLFSISNDLISSSVSPASGIQISDTLRQQSDEVNPLITSPSSSSPASKEGVQQRKQTRNNAAEESSSATNALAVDPNEASSKDTVLVLPVSPVEPVQKEKITDVKQPKNIRYVYKRDTIFQYDTVDVKKKKKKK